VRHGPGEPGPPRIPWYDYFGTAVLSLGIPWREGWEITPHEFWALYDRKFPNQDPPIVARAELAEWMKNRPD
jgi:hypothetical protein